MHLTDLLKVPNLIVFLIVIVLKINILSLLHIQYFLARNRSCFFYIAFIHVKNYLFVGHFFFSFSVLLGFTDIIPGLQSPPKTQTCTGPSPGWPLWMPHMRLLLFSFICAAVQAYMCIIAIWVPDMSQPLVRRCNILGAQHHLNSPTYTTANGMVNHYNFCCISCH